MIGECVPLVEGGAMAKRTLTMTGLGPERGLEPQAGIQGRAGIQRVAQGRVVIIICIVIVTGVEPATEIDNESVFAG